LAAVAAKLLLADVWEFPAWSAPAFITAVLAAATVASLRDGRPAASPEPTAPAAPEAPPEPGPGRLGGAQTLKCRRGMLASTMITAADVRAVAMSLPRTEEHPCTAPSPT